MLTLQSETQIGKLSTVVNLDWVWSSGGFGGLGVGGVWGFPVLGERE